MTWYDVLGVGLGERFGDPDGADERSRNPLMVRPVARSFELAFEGLYRLAYKVAFRIVGDRPEAEDIAQEALARASLRWTRLHEHPEGWVSRVASNLAIDRYRRRRREPHIPVGPLGVVDDRVTERADLVAALRRLPRRQREVVVMRYLADLTEGDVAAALGCSVGAVKTHASRGLAALRRHMGETDAPDGDDVRAS
jgi:RNA polymerase sigma-70 factor (sigma-E family)